MRPGDPGLRNAAAPDDAALLVGHALAWSGNDASVDDLPAHGQIAQTYEVGVEPRKQGIDSNGADQSFAKAPNRRLVGRVVAIVEPQETTKAAPVQDLELSLRIRQAVERLQDQRLEHHHRVHRLAAVLAIDGALQSRVQRRPEYLAVD